MQNSMRITTGMLNDVLAYATTRVQPPSDKGRRLKIYYITQPSTKPPTFVIFVNRADLFHFSYQRYLENCIRSTFRLEGTPITITIRQKGEDDGCPTSFGQRCSPCSWWYCWAIFWAASTAPCW